MEDTNETLLILMRSMIVCFLVIGILLWYLHYDTPIGGMYAAHVPSNAPREYKGYLPPKSVHRVCVDSVTPSSAPVSVESGNAENI